MAIGSGFHHQAAANERHSPYHQEFADAAARTADATVYVAEDLYKKAFQIDTNEEFVLTSINPTTWTKVADSAGTAGTSISAHEQAIDPHPGYVQETLLDGLIATYLDRHHVAQDVPANNNTTSPVAYITGSFNLAHAAQYMVLANYIWSMNSAATDILIELRIDGNVVGPTHRHEPQDTAGAGPYGTDQRYPATLAELVTLTAGAHTFELFFSASTINDNAALYRCDIFVERYI